MFTNTANTTKIIAQISLIFFLYLVVSYFYQGIINPIPAPGDSTTYHIPISQSILNGTFIQPSHFTRKMFDGLLLPGSSEAINSILILLHIPLTISNLLAILVLFLCCYILGRTFTLDVYYALLFTITICTLTAIARWFNAVSIDVWMGVFFTLAITLLEKPKKTYFYAFLLGVILGMFIGSKYTAWFFLLGLLLAYYKTFIRLFSFRMLLVFIIPFSLLGLFWYVRNYLAVGNPIWPICFLTFPCLPEQFNTHAQMWDTTIKYPVTMVNAFYSEYKLWGLTLFIPLYVLYALIKRKTLPEKIPMLAFISFFNFLMFLPLPTSYQPWIMVSSFRYSYPVFITFILSAFILMKFFKKEALIGFFAIANMFPILSLPYLPKTLLFYFPISLFFLYIFDYLERKTIVKQINTSKITKVNPNKKKK